MISVYTKINLKCNIYTLNRIFDIHLCYEILSILVGIRPWHVFATNNALLFSHRTIPRTVLKIVIIHITTLEK